MKYDLIVIGGGIAGINAAMAAKDTGASVLLIEQESLGGLALKGGDKFIKYLYRSLSLMEKFKNSNEYSIKTKNNNFEIDFFGLINRYDVITKKISAVKKKQLLEKKIDLIYGKGEILNNKTVLVNGNKIDTDAIIIAWGGKPVKPYITGIEQAFLNNFVIWSNEIKNLEAFPKSIAIIGGDSAGLELTIVLSALGVTTYLIVKEKTVLKSADSEVIEQFIRKNMNDHMILMYKSEVTEFKGGSIDVNTEGKTIEINVDKVVLATGFSVNKEDIRNMKINCNNDGIIINEYGETNIEGVYAIGDASHFPKFSNLAIIEGNNAVANLYGNVSKMQLPFFVRGFRGIIEAASYGFSEEELIKNNVLYEKMYLNYGALKINTSYDDEEYIKILFDRLSGKMLGVHLVSKNAISDISLLLLMMENFNYYEKKHVFMSTYLSDLSRIIEISENIFINHDVIQLKNNFISFYQPKYNLETNTIIGCESLTRVIIGGAPRTPFELIEIYEKNGFIGEIDLMSLRNSCILLNRLKQKGVLSNEFAVSTNFSPVTLTNISIENILNILSEFDIKPDRIIIEITERSMINSNELSVILKSLQELGFKISLDDFSTGASGISLLNTLPLDEIKLDMSILPRDDTDEILKKIYLYTVNMLKSLHFDIIAEGVETLYQIEFLKENGIKNVQGFYFSKPIDIDSFLKLFQ